MKKYLIENFIFCAVVGIKDFHSQFSFTNGSHTTSRIFSTKCFFTDHLKQKTVDNTTSTKLLANPRELYAHVGEQFQLGHTESRINKKLILNHMRLNIYMAFSVT